MLTLATGKKRYIDQAINLARSVRLHNPKVPIAIVTDSDDPRLERNFDHIHRFRPEMGPVFRQKLCLTEYSTFAKTLYIDSDCLVFDDLEPVFTDLDTDVFNMPVTKISEGVWYRDIHGWLNLMNTSYIPKHNSGCFLFSKSAQAKDFFSIARNYYDRLSDFGIPQTHSAMSDEPAIAMAMIEFGLDGIDFDYRAMASPLCPNVTGYRYRVLRGQVIFDVLDKKKSPAIFHFLAGTWMHPEYMWECHKLHWVIERGYPIWIVESSHELAWFLTYGVGRRAKRFLKLFGIHHLVRRMRLIKVRS